MFVLIVIIHGPLDLLSYDKSGFVKMTDIFQIAVFIALFWIYYNIVVLFKSLRSWLRRDRLEDSKRPRTNMLINWISIVIGWLLGRK